MRSSRPPSTLSLLTLLLSLSQCSVGKPYRRKNAPLELGGHSFLRARSCANPCGWSGQLCCATNQVCFTDSAGQAQCGAGAAGAGNAGGYQGGQDGQWQLFTTTYVETGYVTLVSTYSSYIVVPTANLVAPTPVATTIQAPAAPAPTPLNCALPCGNICCASGQYCAMANQCAAEAAGGFSSAYYSSYYNTYTYTTTPPYSAPLRPTSGTPTTTTSTAAVLTATVPFQTPIGTAGGIVYGPGTTGNNKGLSNGAIAGIVVGVLLGILFLLALIAALFYGAGRRIFGRERVIEQETYTRREHRSRYGAAGGGPPLERRNWIGIRQKPPGPPRPGGGGGFGGFSSVLAGLAALAVVLGLKRRHDRRKQQPMSYSSGSSYTYSDDYGTSESSASTIPRSRSRNRR
ncbi:MAG: hypothetical protein M1826_000912 [Phylliscum demangeonii]|nr:MAG: hypothetical protein M1826_000912 [Phylliscum demangeonii]